MAARQSGRTSPSRARALCSTFTVYRRNSILVRCVCVGVGVGVDVLDQGTFTFDSTHGPSFLESPLAVGFSDAGACWEQVRVGALVGVVDSLGRTEQVSIGCPAESPVRLAPFARPAPVAALAALEVDSCASGDPAFCSPEAHAEGLSAHLPEPGSSPRCTHKPTSRF